MSGLRTCPPFAAVPQVWVRWVERSADRLDIGCVCGRNRLQPIADLHASCDEPAVGIVTYLEEKTGLWAMWRS